MKRLCFFAVLVCLVSCMPYEERTEREINLDFSDPTIQLIYTFQDQQSSDSLYTYFDSPNPSYRYAAAMAFASVQDTSALVKLGGLLKDKVLQVREAAAYAIGQTGNELGEPLLINAFEQFDSTGVYKQFNANILEAIGKCGTKQQLKNLAAISTYKSTDTLLLQGQAWGIYRYSLRGITNNEGTDKMQNLALDESLPSEVRFVAANYLARAAKIKIDTTKSLIPAVLQEQDPNIKMSLVIALGKSKTAQARTTLINLFRTETDYRVKCNTIRALSNFDYLRVQKLVLEALQDPNDMVALTAAQFLRDHGSVEAGRLYWDKARTENRWRVRAMLFEAANKNIPNYFTNSKNTLSAELWKRFNESDNNYEKAALINALSHFGWNYKTIKERSFTHESAAVRSAGVSAMIAILQDPDYLKTFKVSARRARRDINGYLREAILSKDVGMMALAADLVRDKDLNFKRIWKDSTFLATAQKGLSLPKEVETYNALQRSIDFLQGNTESTVKTLEYNNPIDWAALKNISDKTRAIVATSKGNFTLQFFPKLAPGSVENFVRLAKDAYFDNKFVHRVVPNFVMQTGCNRGDGMGGEDFSIRSELPQMYYDNEGYVGMASAGRHTEGTQWFVTHSPTPHLDGRYTIFAKVINGMDVVHKIEQGDRIAKVVIK